MKRIVRRILIGLAFLTPALVVCFFVLGKPRQPLHPKTVNHKHPGKENMVAVLKQEDLSESLVQMTKDDNQFFFPGYNPIDRFAPVDLEKMLSSRRSVKVIQDIKALSEDAQAAACMRLFAEAFQKHTNACRTVLRHASNLALPTNTQSMLTTKLAISAALFTTAELGRIDLLADQFHALNQWCNECEPLARVPHARGFGPSLENQYIAPDYRLQVNVLRLAALRYGDTAMLGRVDAELAANMEAKEFPIVAWDAKTTAYEILPDSPLDTSKGLVKYKFYEWRSFCRNPYDSGLERELQKPVVLKLQSIVFRNGVNR